MVIYLDVLILINLYVTYFQILAVAAFTQKNSMVQKAVCGRHRCGGITEYFHSAGNGFDSYFT